MSRGLLEQGLVHQPEGFLQLGERVAPGHGGVAAPVILEKIETPLGKARGILFFMLVTADAGGAVERAGRAVKCPP